jgi:hypothetical protein
MVGAGRARVERLREMTASEVGVEALELLDKHVERIAPECVADLFALSELALPGHTGEALHNFVRRASRELGDLSPAGRNVFLVDIGELPPQRVPANLRAVLGRIPGGAQLLTHIAPTTPEVVKLPEPLPVAQQPRTGRITTPEVAAARRKVAPTREEREERAREEARPARARAERAMRPVKPRLEDDPRYAWLREQLLGRLSEFAYRDRGLLEAVIVSSIRAAAVRAESPWPTLTQEDVRATLRALSRDGRVVSRSGRWVFVR